MAEEADQSCRFYLSYTGIALPLNLVNPIAAEALTNRNTYIRAYFDRTGALIGFDKVVYGEVELTHRYQYYGSGVLHRAEIAMLDEETVVLRFNEAGVQIADASDAA